MFKKIMCFASFMVVCSAANAVQEIKGKIKLIEATYMPSKITLIMDTGNSACPAGTWLKWENSSQENNKAVLSILMAAMLSGKKISFLINDNDTSCVGRYLYINE